MIKACGGVHFYFIILFAAYSVTRTCASQLWDAYSQKGYPALRVTAKGSVRECRKTLFLDGSSGRFICLNLR